jgi:hypothetical protein
MTKLACPALVALMLAAPVSRAQEPPRMPDFMALQKWATAKVIHFHIEGERSGWVQVWDGCSQLNIDDRVILDFDWDYQAQKMLGHGSFQNFKTVVKGTGSSPPGQPPILKGDYEHLDVKEFSLPEGSGEVHLKGTLSLPAAEVSLNCPLTGKRYPVEASQKPVEERFVLTMPLIMFQGAGAPSDVKIAPDNKSYRVGTGALWVWTYTPTITR